MHDCGMQNRMALYLLSRDRREAVRQVINSASGQFPFVVWYCPGNSRPGLITAFRRSKHA